MTRRMQIVLAAAAVCTLVFGAVVVYMILCTVPGSSEMVAAGWTWLASGYAALGLLIYYQRLDSAYCLQAICRG